MFSNTSTAFRSLTCRIRLVLFCLLRLSYSKKQRNKDGVRATTAQLCPGRDTFEFDQGHVTKNQPITVLILLSEFISVYGDFFVRERACFPAVNQNEFHWLNFAQAIFFLCYVTNERIQWQNEFVRFRRVLVKREISSLYHSKWELLRVITKKREERKRN